MKNLKHKGYSGTIEYSNVDGILYGKVLGIKGLISYEGETQNALKKNFQVAVDEYLNGC